ncbi:MAG: hypothetical protein LBF74_11390, partial [Treponema sp.]|nr:hypothetical protein [Treponema sp.]
PWTYAPGITDKADFPNSQVKVVLSVTGDQDPRLALNYRMASATGPYYFDYIVLSTAKMKVNSDRSLTLDVSDLLPILDNRVALLSPLQSKGFKILLGVTNGGGGITFANLPYTLRQPFAKTIKDTLDRYGLDGIEFNDENGGEGAYPEIGMEFYDPVNDEQENPNTLWDTVAPGTDYDVDYYWHEGGYNYSAFLTYFRLNVQSWETPTTSVIGAWQDNPILVRETGFAGGKTGNSYDTPNNYMQDMIRDAHREEMEFTSITNQVNYFLSPRVLGGTGDQPFGWEGSGQSVMPYAVHGLYSPGILDLESTADSQIRAFSRRFAEGNKENQDYDLDWGAIYGILYYTNLNDSDVAAKLSISSKWVYGSREVNAQAQLEAVHEDGPDVVYVRTN